MHLGTERVVEKRTGRWYLADTNGADELQFATVRDSAICLVNTTSCFGVRCEVITAAALVCAQLRIVEDNGPHREYLWPVGISRLYLRVRRRPTGKIVPFRILIGAGFWRRDRH